MNSETPTRYSGRPLIALLEMFVMESIGELDPKKRALAQVLVHRTWGEGDWLEVIRRELHLNDSIGEQLKKMWRNNKAIARQQNTTLTPEEYAKMVVDSNWSKLVTPI